MALFVCLEHGFKVIPLDVSKIMARKAIGLNLEILGSEQGKNPKLFTWKWNAAR